MVIRVPYPYPEWQQTVIYGVGRSRLGEGGRLKDNTGKRQGPSEGLERSLFDFSGLRIRRRFLLSSMGVGCSGGNLTDQLDDRASSRGTRVVCEPRRGDDPLKGSTGSATGRPLPVGRWPAGVSALWTVIQPALVSAAELVGELGDEPGGEGVSHHGHVLEGHFVVRYRRGVVATE